MLPYKLNASVHADLKMIFAATAASAATADARETACHRVRAGAQVHTHSNAVSNGKSADVAVELVSSNMLT